MGTKRTMRALIVVMVEGIAYPQADRKRLLKQMEMGESYQKSRHAKHCEMHSDCITHCTIFALSDPNCAEQYLQCNQEDTAVCSDCNNILETLDEIKQRSENIVDPELQADAAYDFENASEHIMEWFRHNVRAAQQDFEKTKIISTMGIDEAFCTFDRGQKILPQEYRESQKKSISEKKGMSILVGSFVWKSGSTSAVFQNTASIANISHNFRTESYILAITHASQTEIDTLSGGEII